MTKMPSEGDLSIVFVLPDENRDAGEAMQKAFSMTEKKRFNPRWLNINACLRLVKETQTIFVCEDIDDPKLGKIKSAYSRIIGPMCIITCYERSMELPRLDHPVFIPTMVNLIICCTSLERDARNEIHRKVQLMGAVISRNFTKGVTHLIAGEVGSKKYHVAASEKLPIMLPAWVDECWERGQTEAVHARDPCFDHLKCPIFLGVRLTVSQVEGSVRQSVRDLVEANGGKYSGHMKSDETTHLVLLHPDGEKYTFGRKWKLHCVNVNWVYDSVEKKYCQDEVLYDIDNGTVEKKVDGQTPVKKASTPLHGHSNTNMENTVMNFSAVAPGSKQFNSSDLTSVEETYVSQNNGNEKTWLNMVKVVALKEDFDGCLKALQMREDAGLFLDGCKIVMMGLNGHAMDCVRKVVNAGGGIRYNNINNDVTHVVLGDMPPNLLKTLQDSGIRPHVVSLKWLVESRKQGKPVEESPFRLINYDNHLPSSTSDETVLEQVNVNVNVTDKSEKSQSKVNAYFDEGTDIDDILMQYKIPITTSTHAANGLGLDEIIAKASVESEGGVLGSQNLFINLTFLVEGFTEAETSNLSSIIESSGGKIAVTVATPNTITVVPVIGYDTTSMKNRKIVTDCWLLSCAEVSTLMPVREQRVYVPIEYKPDSQPLTNCVFSLSHYKGHVKDTLITIGRYLGARYEESMARCSNPKTGRLANTHLICGLPEGKKYEGAVRWKMPAVTADWLLDCAKDGQMLPEEEYPPKEPEAPGKALDIAQDTTNIAQSTVEKAECVNSNTKCEDGSGVNSVNKGTSASSNLSQTVHNKTRPSLRELDITVAPTGTRPYQHVVLTPDLKTPKLKMNIGGIKAAPVVSKATSEIESVKDKTGCLNDSDSPANFMSKDFPVSHPKFDFGARVVKHNVFPKSLGYKLSQKISSFKLLGTGKSESGTPTSVVKPKEATTETVHKQMDDMLAAARVSNIKSNVGGNSPALRGERSPIPFDLGEHRKTVLKPAPEPSQAATVTWDDPTSRSEREKLHMELHRDSQAEVNPVIEQENRPLKQGFSVDSTEIINPTPRFMFSGLPSKDRGMYRKIVEDLDGTVSDSEDFDQSCTHLIIGLLSRNEKMLGAIASGLWVLKKSYLVRCREAGEFVAEEDHVWRSNELTPGSRAASLADAAVRWRLSIQEAKKYGGGKIFPFDGWRAVVHLSDQRQGSICRLLKAGGATVLPHRPPFTGVTDATHAFLETSVLPKSFVDVESLVDNGVHCLQMEYIGNYLMESNPPAESAYLIPEAEKRINMSGNKCQKRKSSDDDSTLADDRTGINTKRKK